jgi:hypothetical protein
MVQYGPARLDASKEALDAAGDGMPGGMDETFEQLDELLVDSSEEA